MRSIRQAKAGALFVRADEQWVRGKLRSAFRLFLAAAKLGDAGARVNIGYFYDVGLGVQRNRQTALNWYRKAYRAGMSVAATNIGIVYRDEGKPERAVDWFRRAIALGDPEPNLELAKIYLDKEDGKRKAIACLKSVIRAKASAVTEAGREEAEELLKRIKQAGTEDS
jgi:hypothetical protein